MKARRAAHHAFDCALRQTTGSGMVSKATRGFVKSWRERTKGEVSLGTWAKSVQTAERFLASLGDKADHDMSTVRQ